MKKFTLYLQLSLFILSGSLIIACKSSNKNEKAYLSSLTSSDEKVKLADSDFRFLIKAYATGLYKISLAKEAQVRSTSAESHQLANAIVSFHTDVNNQIQDFANQHAFSLPDDLTTEQKQGWKSLIKEKGWNFDKKFAAMLDELSSAEAAVYDQAIKNVSDQSVALLAQKAQPDLQLHNLLRTTLNERIEVRMLAFAPKGDEDNKQILAKARTKKATATP